ncbi:MAG TPA: M24 family metallopeptidase [Chloroflexota bacterium]|nr:M24 family metallopeptidase [Chloroflexota bacterium]
MTPEPIMKKTWDDQRLKRDRLEQLQAAMAKFGVGALYLTEGESVRYAINLRIPGGAALVPAHGEPIAFVRSLDMGYVRLAHPNVRPHIYRSEPTDAEADQKALRWADAMRDLMAELGVGGEPLGLDATDPVAFLALNSRGFRMQNAQKILESAKEVKTQDEIAIYWEMGKFYSEIMRYFRDTIRPGITEQEMVSLMTAHVFSLGAEGLLQINVCSGENMNPWRRWPTARQFQEGDLIGMDIHVYGPGGYIFDSGRTYLCGSNANAASGELYRRAHDYNNAVTELIKPGLPITELKSSLPALPEKYQELVYSFHVAHSTGLTPGEYPSIMKHQKPVDDVLKTGQILSVDTVYGEFGDGLAVKLEEQVLVTDKGAVKMADMPYEEALLGR